MLARARTGVPAALHGPLGTRLITAAVGVPLLIGVVLAGTEPLAALVALALAVGVYEFCRANGLNMTDPALWLAAAGAAAMAAVAATDNIPTIWPFTAAVAAVVAAPIFADMVTDRARVGQAADAARFEGAARRTMVGVFALVYVGWLGSFFVLLRATAGGEDWLLLALGAIMTADSAAFLVGRRWGRHRLAPRISPAKTVEGAVGGCVAGYVAVILLRLLLDIDVPYWQITLLALTLPLISQVGDLTESLLKRAVGVKDFSQLIPGHGGVLDRLDSLLFGVTWVYLVLQWIVR